MEAIRSFEVFDVCLLEPEHAGFSPLRRGFVVATQRLVGAAEGGLMAMNGTGGPQGAEDYQQWMEGRGQGKAPRHGADVYSNTLPVRKVAPAKSKASLSKIKAAFDLQL